MTHGGLLMPVHSLKSLSQPPLLCLCAMLLWATGCNFSDNAASDEASARTPDQGISTRPDEGVVPDVGMTIPQMDMTGLNGDCTPLADEALCAQRSLQCGEVEITDNCGLARDIECGECGEDESCDTTTSLCECVPKTDADLCSTLGLQCGPSRTLDNCGMPRVVDCGGCEESDVLCEANMCSGCAPETNEALCARLNKDCGSISAADNCGEMRVDVTCGVCEAPETCGADNVCTCVPESDTQMCDRLGKNCGVLNASDNCDTPRDIDCGDDCGTGACLSDNTCSVCMPESDEAFCSRMGSTCGQRDGTDNCGAPRSASCGICEGGETCQGNQCVCPAPVCPGRASCGIVSSLCGASIDCGSCEAGEACLGNMCICQPPSCQGIQCGTVSNLCGASSNCGSCAGSNDSCINSTCVCQGETQFELCQAQNASCGNIQTIDRCGVQRSVNCGFCTGGQYCANTNTCCQNNQICDLAIE